MIERRLGLAVALVSGSLTLASCGAAPVQRGDARPKRAETGGAAARDDRAQAPIPVPLATAPGGGMIVQKNVMVAMRDGVRLATDIYRPAGREQYPVVLMRTPYGSESPATAKQAQYYVEHGYAFAIQDCRGKYDSEGDWYGKRDEAQDGSDAITWLGTQPWSNGNVGMTGGSYLGMVQYLVADQANSYLKAMVPMVAPLTLGRDTADFDHLSVYGGREHTAMLAWMLLTDGRVNQADGQGDASGFLFRTARQHLPRVDYPRVFGREMTWWTFVSSHRYGFWEEYFLRASLGEWSKPIPSAATWWGGYQERYKKVRVPMLHISGWFDCCGEQLIKMFQLVRQHAAEPLARDNQQLVMGPWVHAIGQSKNGEVDFGPQALLDADSVSVRWFDRWLKGIDNGVDKEPPVRAFVMGENQWRAASDWPIPGTTFTKFYFHSKGDARLVRGGGSLSAGAPNDEPADHYVYDPGNPTPGRRNADTAEAVLGSSDMIYGSANLTPLEMRDDILVYTTEAVNEPVELTGPVAAMIYLTTSAPSTDLMVRLLDVHPDGKAYNVYLTYAGPYRTHWAKTMERGPGGEPIIKAEIQLPPTSILIRRGHRVRVEISSAAAPRIRGLNAEPGTEATATKWNVAEQHIYHDAARPSHVVLPVIPR